MKQTQRKTLYLKLVITYIVKIVNRVAELKNYDVTDFSHYTTQCESKKTWVNPGVSSHPYCDNGSLNRKQANKI